MTLDLINNAALLLAICWLQSLISRRWQAGSLRAQVMSGLLFSVATVTVMMTSILLAPGLWLWTDSSMAVVSVASLCYGPIAGGLAALAGIAYKAWMGGAIATGAIINLLVSFAAGMAFRIAFRRLGTTPDWRFFLLLGLLVYGIGSWQLFAFHLDVSSALTPGFFVTLLVIMVPVTALLGLQLQYIERKSALEKEVYQLAHFDTLTGLPNRNNTIEKLRQLSGEGTRPAGPFSVIMIYLQDFQLFNESLGAGVGDFILRETSRRLSALADSGTFVSRLSGLEFAVILHQGKDGDTPGFGLTLGQALAEPIAFNDKLLKLDIAMGAAHFPRDGKDAYEVLRKASLALQEARGHKGQIFVQFSDNMEQAIQESLALRRDLAQAVDRNELEVFYQPYLDLASNQIQGIEALVRWNHPQHGLKGPAFFLEAAEKSGLITSLGAWVIEAACRQARMLDSANLPFATLSVNVSLMQLADHNFPEIVRSILQNTGLEARRLTLEVSETAFARQSDRVLGIVRQLQAMGIGFAIDNFGSDYTSLRFIKQAGVQLIKVDRAYIASLATSEESRQIVPAFIQIARSLGVKSLAVGVEDEAGRAHCAALGFDMAQGYFYSKPLGERDLVALLSATSSGG